MPETTHHLQIEIPLGQIEQFCRQWKIADLSIFGSALRDDFGPESDVDILVAFDQDAHWTLFDLADMEDELSALVGRRVDLVSRTGLMHSRNWLRRREILRTAEPLYVAG